MPHGKLEIEVAVWCVAQRRQISEIPLHRITALPFVSRSLTLGSSPLSRPAVGMVGGFFAIGAGHLALAMALPAEGAAVSQGVLIGCWDIGITQLRSRPLPPPGRIALSEVAFLILAVTLGFSCALALIVPALVPYLTPPLGGVGDHARAGLGGWVSLTGVGVSYTLLPMCMLAAKARGIAGKGAHVLRTVRS